MQARTHQLTMFFFKNRRLKRQILKKKKKIEVKLILHENVNLRQKKVRVTRKVGSNFTPVFIADTRHTLEIYDRRGYGCINETLAKTINSVAAKCYNLIDNTDRFIVM